jgi:hypothetical protein
MTEVLAFPNDPTPFERVVGGTHSTSLSPDRSPHLQSKIQLGSKLDGQPGIYEPVPRRTQESQGS